MSILKFGKGKVNIRPIYFPPPQLMYDLCHSHIKKGIVRKFNSLMHYLYTNIEGGSYVQSIAVYKVAAFISACA